MKKQLATLLPVLALVISVPALTGIAHANISQQALTAAPTANQSERHHQRGRMGNLDMGGHVDDLNLSNEQKTKMQQLRQSTRAQIEAVLTAEQRQKFQQITSQDRGRNGSGAGLSLTTDQKVQLKAMQQNHRSQLQAILTPAQRAQLNQERYRGQGGMMARLEKLNLTSEQKSKLESLRAARRKEMDAILTPAQQQTAKTMLARQTIGRNWQSLNLTADQQAKIKAIRQASQSQFMEILTPAQQTKLKAGRHHGGQRGGHNFM
jgi:Spy/CpxP family protein refolding chaperone